MYINNHATENDIVVDIDNIYQMLSVNDKYIHPETLKTVVLKTRDFLYGIVRKREGDWENAYVAVPHTGEYIKYLASNLKADECIEIKATKEECLERAKERPPIWLSYINGEK